MTVLLVSFLCELWVSALSFFYSVFSALSVHSVLILSFSFNFQLLTSFSTVPPPSHD
jgi:hypothetical protein